MCCGNRPDAVAGALLARLAEAGVALPEGAQVWNASRRGWRWRVMDRRGREADPPVGSSCEARDLVAAGPLRAVERDGALHVHGAEPCGWA